MNGSPKVSLPTLTTLIAEFPCQHREQAVMKVGLSSNYFGGFPVQAISCKGCWLNLSYTSSKFDWTCLVGTKVI